MFPVLIDIMKSSDFKTRKEAAWALVNATSGGSPDQIRYLVNQGCIPPLCDFLTAQDAKIVQVALNGLENILKVGDADSKVSGDVNRFAVLIEECFGMIYEFIRTWLMINSATVGFQVIWFPYSLIPLKCKFSVDIIFNVFSLCRRNFQCFFPEFLKNYN